MPDLHPLLILLIGMAIVIGLIIGLKINAFLAMITAAIVVSLLSPGDPATKIARVAAAFGTAAGNIGIVIALAAVVGKCLMDSGAADRIVRAFVGALGERRAATALMGSGFVLAVPVFFDTVFYLLVPLARSLHRRTRADYLKYLLAISAGGAVTHTLVPPTPGPLLMADTLGVDLGVMMLVGTLVAFPTACVGLVFSGWRNRRMPIEMRPLPGDDDAVVPIEGPATALPGLFVSALPIILPVVMISSNTIMSRLAQAPDAGPGIIAGARWVAVLGNANFALLVSAAIALLVYVRQRRPGRDRAAHEIETALMSGGVIILITAAGGAFGAMLKEAQLGPWIQGLFATDTKTAGFGLLVLGFAIAALLKVAQGSSTVAMITASSMLAAMVTPSALGFHPVYLATAVGSGSLVGSWMNDSGFWIFAKMGGVTEMEALQSWTVLLVVLGVTGLLVTMVFAAFLPLR
jgi:gluconate:H+ symporter, GntP family